MFPHATGDPTAWVVMGGQGRLVQHPAAGLSKWGRCLQVWLQWLCEREHSPRVCWVFGHAMRVRGVSEMLSRQRASS